MTRTHLQHRERLYTRHEAARARWPERSGVEFAREMRSVAQSLTELAREADTLRGDPSERARTWRYASEAWLDLGQDPECMARACAALERSNDLEGGSEEPTAALFEVVKRQFEKDRPNMDDVRRSGLKELLERIERLVQDDAQGRDAPDEASRQSGIERLSEKLQRRIGDRGKLDSMAAEMLPRIENPTLPGPPLPPDSRARRVLACLQKLKSFLASESIAQGKGARETDSILDLFVRLGRLSTAVHQTSGDEQKLVALEEDQARSLANEVRHYARRRHPALARPVLSRRSVPLDANALFFSGPSATSFSLAALAQRRHLKLNIGVKPGADVAEARWGDLAAASLGVFEISDREPQVFYELGIALALGTELLVIAREGTTPPFDIAQNVCFYADAASLDCFFEEHLDVALYGMQMSGGKGSCIEATLTYAERAAKPAAESDHRIRVMLHQMRAALADPVEFKAALTAFNGYWRLGGHTVIAPRWPVSYFEPGRPCCFVVMPFDPRLETTQKTYCFIAAECSRMGVEDVRGDVSEGQEIIRSIWEETGRASHVLVDLTGFNPNVCLELGIADALGKDSLLIGTAGTEAKLFPDIAKRRCHPYDAEAAGNRRFAAELTRFLQSRRVL